MVFKVVQTQIDIALIRNEKVRLEVLRNKVELESLKKSWSDFVFRLIMVIALTWHSIWLPIHKATCCLQLILLKLMFEFLNYILLLDFSFWILTHFYNNSLFIIEHLHGIVDYN